MLNGMFIIYTKKKMHEQNSIELNSLYSKFFLYKTLKTSVTKIIKHD